METTQNVQPTKPNRDYIRVLAALMVTDLLALLTLSKAAESARGAEILFAGSRNTGRVQLTSKETLPGPSYHQVSTTGSAGNVSAKRWSFKILR